MKQLIIVFILLLGLHAYSQDTTQLVKFYDGTKSFWLISKSDTTLCYDYPNGKKESRRTFKNNQVTGTYTRWYENGKKMWEKELVKNIQEGKTILYNEKGTKIAEFNYTQGAISDTIYLKENIHLVLGNVSYSSTVYGGMERADGSSNVSKSSGPYQNFKMYGAKVDSLKKPVKIQNFKTDFNGDFFITVPEGKISFFPATTKITDVLPGQYYPKEIASMSGNSGWNFTQPFIIGDKKILFIQLHHSSVGYAP